MKSFRGNIKRIMVTALLVGVAVAANACGGSGNLKDMSSEGYPWGFFQHANGTQHDRQLDLIVDRINQWPSATYNVLEGTYFNTGTEAPEHLRDAAGRMIFTQSESRRYFAWTNNDRNDISRIMLFNPLTQTLDTAFMSRYSTEWWGNADLRAISVNNGPVIMRTEGIGKHLLYTDQQVFAVAIPKDGQNYSWMFNQDSAERSRAYLEDLLKELENTNFRPPGQHILISTHDNDKFLDWAGVETAPAQGELFNGQVQYVIGASYVGSHNRPFAGGLFSPLYGHQGAPDKSNKAGSSLDTITIAIGNANNQSSWAPKARIYVNHPTWSKQVEYQFVKVNPDGSEDVKGVLQRTYNDKSVTDSNGKVVEVVATNNYLAKGDTSFIQQVLVLLGGQQVPLGFDYKTSFLDYGLDLIRIGQGISAGQGGLDPEMVASLNVNADATIEHVVSAAENVLGVKVPLEFETLRQQQRDANQRFHTEAPQIPELKQAYGLK